MSPFRTLFAILAVFALLGLISLFFPSNGISVGSLTLRFPSLIENLPQNPSEDSLQVDPEEQIRQMLAETRARKFAEYADSLAFYEDFFDNGPTRFDFPDSNPGWFDRFFDRVSKAKDSGEVVRIVHYGDSQLEGDRITSRICTTPLGRLRPGNASAPRRHPDVRHRKSQRGQPAKTPHFRP